MKPLHINIDALHYSEEISEDMFKSLVDGDYEEVDLTKAMEAGGNVLVPQDLEGVTVVDRSGGKKRKVIKRKEKALTHGEDCKCHDCAGGYSDVEKGVNKTNFSTKERKTLASAGEAESDGSYPVRNMQDLKDAIKAVGRSKNIESTKKHIKKRAKALGLSHLIPETWS